MSGHSKWSTIKRQKGAVDAKRGLTFTKIANAITIAARTGGLGDIDANSRLRYAIDQARSVNMPKDNIQRAIDRGLGKLPGQTLEEVIYEGFGPGKVAFYVEGVTDNKMRTVHEIKNIFERSGGVLGALGSTAYMFDKKGELRLRSQGKSTEQEILELIDIGVLDVEDYLDQGEQKYLVYSTVSELSAMSNKVTQSGYLIESSEVVMVPNLLIDVSNKEITIKVVQLAKRLDEHDDVQKVFINMSTDNDISG